MGVRVATASDVDAIARVLVASWQAAYRGLVPTELLDRMTVEARRRQWAPYFDDPPDRSALFVAETAVVEQDPGEPDPTPGMADGAVMGMIAVGPARAADVDPEIVGEVYAIYVDPRHWGAGHGRDLMIAGLDALGAHGCAEAMLWVLDTNVRGRRFYEGGGWRLDGGTQIDTGFGEPISEVRYRIALADR